MNNKAQAKQSKHLWVVTAKKKEWPNPEEYFYLQPRNISSLRPAKVWTVKLLPANP